MKKLKLTTLSEAILKDKESKSILGGVCCTCSCYWEGKGGSSTNDNRSANYALDIESQHGCNQYFQMSEENKGVFAGAETLIAG